MAGRVVGVVVAATALLTLGMSGVSGAGGEPTPPLPVPGATARAGVVAAPRIDEARPRPLGRAVAASGADVPAAPPVASLASEGLATLLGDRFAGAWDVPTGPRTAVPTVAVVRPTEADRVAVRKLVGPTTDVVAAGHSIKELEATKAELLDKLGASGLDEFAVGVNVPTNTVSAYVDPESGVSPELSSWLTSVADMSVVVMQTTSMGTAAYPSPVWSGQRLFVGTWTAGVYNGCTTGFAMQNSGGTFMTTAAHCAPNNGAPVFGSGGDGGPVGAQVGTIVGMMGTGAVPGDFAAFYLGGVEGYVNGASRKVKGAANPAWLEQGVCFRGASSATEKCAGVSDVNLTISTGGRQFSAFCINHGSGQPAVPGDSGAGVYRAQAAGEANARGIVSGYLGSKTCATPIGSVTGSYGASVLVK